MKDDEYKNVLQSSRETISLINFACFGFCAISGIGIWLSLSMVLMFECIVLLLMSLFLRKLVGNDVSVKSAMVQLSFTNRNYGDQIERLCKILEEGKNAAPDE
jgi:hypothetical protein